MIIGSNAKSNPVRVSDRVVLIRGGGDDGGDSSSARKDDDDARGEDSSCWYVAMARGRGGRRSQVKERAEGAGRS